MAEWFRVGQLGSKPLEWPPSDLKDADTGPPPIIVAGSASAPIVSVPPATGVWPWASARLLHRPGTARVAQAASSQPGSAQLQRQRDYAALYALSYGAPGHAITLYKEDALACYEGWLAAMQPDAAPATSSASARPNRITGIASSIGESARRRSKAGQTNTGGTLPYMSPQQLSGFPPSVTVPCRWAVALPASPQPANMPSRPASPPRPRSLLLRSMSERSMKLSWDVYSRLG